MIRNVVLHYVAEVTDVVRVLHAQPAPTPGTSGHCATGPPCVSTAPADATGTLFPTECLDHTCWACVPTYVPVVQVRLDVDDDGTW